MTGVERIEEWRGEAVIDADGEQLGKLEDVYFDSASGEPLLVSVRSGGLLGRKVRLAPLEGATLGRNHVRIAGSKAQFELGPEIPGSGPFDPAALSVVEEAFEVRLPDQLELWSASELEAHRANADEARRRADELEGTAQERLAERDAARARLKLATEEAEQAERAAEEARAAAVEARRVADSYEPR
jgi:sporulation protein YlmC with PRC-barrel domain